MKAIISNLAPDPEALLSEDQAARFLGLTARFLQKHRQLGDGPAFVRISCRCIRYRRTDLKAWSESRLKTSTAA